jgi:phosphate-selective porin OprO/OprP
LRYPWPVITAASGLGGSTIEAHPITSLISTCLLILVIASIATAQVDPMGSQPPADPTPIPTPPPTPSPEPAAAEAGPPADTNNDAVPERGEEASSDRIRYRDPLDIDYEPVKDKWKRFTDSVLGISRYSFFDDQLRFRIGLRFQADGTLAAPSDQLQASLGDLPDGFDVRRFRVFAEGIVKRMYFRAEFDFAADAGFKSIYLEGRQGGLEIWGHLLGKFRYGLFQEPFSLENNMSTFDTTFVEVSMPINAMAPGANLGAMVYDASANRRFTWAVGAFSLGQSTADNASTSKLSVSGRFGFQPVRYNDGRRMLHVGVSASLRAPTSDNQRYEARPEARFVEPFADTGDIPSNKNALLGLEAAWKGGGNWAHAEWIRSNLDSYEADNPHFDGFVLQAGRFLAGGQSRPWDDLFAVWGRVRPEQAYHGGNPFKKANGGVWEVAARYSTVDLNDGPVKGGSVRDLTAGVNWYPDSTSKLQLNWVYSRVEDQGFANIWVLRYQFAIK